MLSKRAIIGIISLMSIAMLGTIGLQTYWIVNAVQLKEEQFDKSVFDALNMVSRKLEIQEKRAVNEQFVPGRSAIAINSRPSMEGLGNVPHKGGGNICNCVECVNARFEQQVHELERFLFGRSVIGEVSVEERISVKHLDDFLDREFQNKGIDLNYTHGVYSEPKETFVIIDDHYVVESGRGEAPTHLPLYNSKYKVQLFQEQDQVPQGYLMIHFPNKTGYVWSTVWGTLLAATIFTGIVLFCFVYTIKIIVRQKHVSQMKNDFINNMTHEFKTPIATISLAADSITSPMISGSPDKVQPFAGIIKQENRRMNSQVEKVLQMALIDKRDFELKLTDTNINDVVRQAAENIRLQVDKRDGEVNIYLNATKPIIEADTLHISNVINNLLDNANKYSPEQPTITVTTRDVPLGVEVAIKDEGMGMTKEARKRIFDKFYRVHTGNLHDIKGFGLGLSYVKAIITAHKGQIDVASELGQGSEFVLTFPHQVNELP